MLHQSGGLLSLLYPVPGATIDAMVTATLLSGKRILIAEDNFLIGVDLRALIEEGKGSAEIVATNDEALKALDSSRFDVAVVDATLRDGNSELLATGLRARKVPFVVVSGHAQDELSPDLRSAPFMSKPFQQRDLLELVGRVMSRAA